MSPESPARAAGLFLSHIRSSRIDRHFQRLVRETEHLIDWHFVFNPGKGAEPQVDFAYAPSSVCMPARHEEMVANGGVQGGLMDTVILPCALALEADFVWAVEYDVDFSGDWARLFEQFVDNRADLLTSEITPWSASGHWHYWPVARAPAGVTVPQAHKGFHPVMRLSRRFAQAYVRAMAVPGWRGHYEFTLPTFGIAGGFTLEDIGGDGPFCPPARRGTNYVDPSAAGRRGACTFQWRPSRQGYFIEAPDQFERADMLYHPVKPDVLDWDKKAPTMFAYLLLAHRSPRQVARLVARLRNERAHVFIHVDAKSDVQAFVAAFAGQSGVTVIRDRVKIMWGGFGMVQATLNLLQAARAAGSHQRFVLLSEACYPVSDIRSIQKRLSSFDGELITIDRELMVGGGSTFDARISHYHLNDHEFLGTRGKAFDTTNEQLKPISDNLNELCVTLQAYLNGFIESVPFARQAPESGVFHGSQWWCLTDGCVDGILRLLEDTPAFTEFFRFSLIPDEMFFHSAVMATRFRERVPKSAAQAPLLQLFDWDRPNRDRSYPRTMSLEDYERIRASGALFVRKVDDALSGELMDRLDRDARPS